MKKELEKDKGEMTSKKRSGKDEEKMALEGEEKDGEEKSMNQEE